MPVVNKIKRKSGPQKIGWRWFIIISFLFCELLVHVWIRTETTQVILGLSRTEKQLLEQQSYQKALSVEIDRLKSEDRIRRIARSRLMLIRDDGTQTLYLPEGMH